MNWAIAGLVYAGVYAALMTGLADQPAARVLAGNVALLIPPLAPLFVIARRRRVWRGRQAAFWGAIAAGAALWWVGQLFWSVDEVLRAVPLPWLQWHMVLKLGGSALPIIALVAWPHRSAEAEQTITVTLDITVLAFLTCFLYWCLIVAPGINSEQSLVALRTLAVTALIVRLAAVGALLWAAQAAGKNAWADVYRRLAFGMFLAAAALVALLVLAARGTYQTGSPTDISWMMPFWFAAWAAATSPGSPFPSRISPTRPIRQSSPLLLFVALLIVPLVGYGLRYLMPLGEAVDRPARHRDGVRARGRDCPGAGPPAASSSAWPSRPTSGCACWRRPANRREN